MLNVVDGGNLDFLRSEVRTLQQTFPYVALVPPDGTWPTSGRSTFVIVAGAADPGLAAVTLPAGKLESFVADGASVVLTDDHAPVDQLLAPVFRDRLRG
jgi:hypothetical protein